MADFLLTPVLVLHVGAGVTGLVTGTIAICARKGGRLHRFVGNVFFVSMMAMAGFAIVLAVIIPDQLINVLIGIFALYLVGTAWLTVRRQAREAGLFEKIALAVSVCLCAPFVIISGDLALGLPPLFHSAIPLEGPVLMALIVFTTILLIAAATDARVVWLGGISGAPRIARHLWRMCLGLGLAAGSGFTNGVARLLPGPYHVPTVLFLPQFVPVLLMIFWLIRVRFTGWYESPAPRQRRK